MPPSVINRHISSTQKPQVSGCRVRQSRDGILPLAQKVLLGVPDHLLTEHGMQGCKGPLSPPRLPAPSPPRLTPR